MDEQRKQLLIECGADYDDIKTIDRLADDKSLADALGRLFTEKTRKQYERLQVLVKNGLVIESQLVAGAIDEAVEIATILGLELES